MRIALTATAVLLAAAAAAAPAAPAATEKHCGDVAGPVDAPQDVRALNVSCKKARRLAKRHSNNSGRNDVCDLGARSCMLDGWRCSRTFFGNSGTRVKCTKEDKRVRFFYGT